MTVSAVFDQSFGDMNQITDTHKKIHSSDYGKSSFNYSSNTVE